MSVARRTCNSAPSFLAQVYQTLLRITVPPERSLRPRLSVVLLRVAFVPQMPAQALLRRLAAIVAHVPNVLAHASDGALLVRILAEAWHLVLVLLCVPRFLLPFGVGVPLHPPLSTSLVVDEPALVPELAAAFVAVLEAQSGLDLLLRCPRPFSLLRGIRRVVAPLARFALVALAELPPVPAHSSLPLRQLRLVLVRSRSLLVTLTLSAAVAAAPSLAAADVDLKVGRPARPLIGPASRLLFLAPRLQVFQRLPLFARRRGSELEVAFALRFFLVLEQPPQNDLVREVLLAPLSVTRQVVLLRPDLRHQLLEAGRHPFDENSAPVQGGVRPLDFALVLHGDLLVGVAQLDVPQPRLVDRLVAVLHSVVGVARDEVEHLLVQHLSDRHVLLHDQRHCLRVQREAVLEQSFLTIVLVDEVLQRPSFQHKTPRVPNACGHIVHDRRPLRRLQHHEVPDRHLRVQDGHGRASTSLVQQGRCGLPPSTPPRQGAPLLAVPLDGAHSGREHRVVHAARRLGLALLLGP